MLMDAGPHTVDVENVTSITRDAYGGRERVYAEPVRVQCMVQPTRAGEAGPGVQVDTVIQVMCRVWPGRPYSRVTIVDGPYAGRVFHQQGETMTHRVGTLTRHDKAVLAAQAGVG